MNAVEGYLRDIEAAGIADERARATIVAGWMIATALREVANKIEGARERQLQGRGSNRRGARPGRGHARDDRGGASRRCAVDSPSDARIDRRLGTRSRPPCTDRRKRPKSGRRSRATASDLSGYPGPCLRAL